MSDDEEAAVAPPSGRSRRRTTKKVNYAKEQEFSDEDIFQDSDDEIAVPRGRKSRASTGSRRGRASTAHEEGTVDDSGKVQFTEKGYDSSLPPIRERFPFLPEYEEDGTAKIELIVGRRPIDEGDDTEGKGDSKDDDSENDSEEETGGRRRTRKKEAKGSPKKKDPTTSQSGVIEYEYLVKYKGRSYLHLDWLRGADLESMNKSAKGIYRRFLKKLAQGIEEDLENSDFDPAYVVAQKIVDEQEQEITVELSDKELLKWEKQREKEIAAAALEDDDDKDDDDQQDKADDKDKSSTDEKEATDQKADKSPIVWEDKDIDYSTLDIEKLRAIIDSEGPYFPKIEGSDNPYRDGYVKEAPRKPRASYLFFQGTMRGYFSLRNPNSSQAELMTMMGNTWQTLSEEQRRPFVELAQQESKQYEKELAMIEKAQRPNEVWQPLRRCLMVLERLASDSFAEIFLEPVDTEEFPDYDEIIDSPMDLATVRTNIKTKKYMSPEQYARDMRKIWNSCKIYNQHGSAIWHVADYMSKQFERLYHAWVLEFRERYLRWADPRARPWEHSCRASDGKCGSKDNEMVLCDHCDAMYSIKCLKPPLKKVPTRAWHCPECKPKLKTVKGARMLSAVAENAARKRAELGDVPKKKIKQTMFLVKWSGLGYEHCTWETRADINDDSLISAFRRLNKGAADESMLPKAELDKMMKDVKHVYNDTEKGEPIVNSLKAQLYAQTRGFQFSRFGSSLPPELYGECGPQSLSTKNQKPRPVVECLTDLVFRAERGERPAADSSDFGLPPPLTGEYDATIPITSKGLLMNVGEVHGSVAFLGYRQFPDGSKGPAEINNLIRGVGDKIIAVDGKSTVGKSFKEVIALLRLSGKNKYAYMRFLESRFAICEGNLASVGTYGRYAIDELQRKFTNDRQKVMLDRMLQGDDNNVDHLQDLDPEVADEDDSDAEVDSDVGSEGEFQPDSDDEDLLVTGTAKEVDPIDDDESEGKPETKETVATPDDSKNKGESSEATLDNTEKPTDGIEEDSPVSKGIMTQHENTRSLGYRLLDMDLGYSSDEGGDEDCVYFVDGVDGTFSKGQEIEMEVPLESPPKNGKAAEDTLPAKQSDFLTLGEQARLACASAIHPDEPSPEEFVNYPNPPVEEEKPEAEETIASSPSPTKATRLSTVKVEQVDMSTGEVIHTWANIEAAAATLQLRLDQLKSLLSGEYDEDLGDEVGGYKWRYAPVGAEVTAGVKDTSRGAGGKKAKQAWLEFREKLYDPSEPHPYKNNNRLRDYQVDGVNWLASTWYKKQGCILADEMGLGKTVQIVCYIEHIFRAEKVPRPYLVVVPLSTVEHWRREFEGWTDMVCCVYHDRQRVWRDVMREYEWYFEDRPHTPDFLKFDVLVTTYDTLISDFDVVSQIPFRIAVVDEAHRLRNQKGKLLECMREISAKGNIVHGFQSRVLISGTPLQNDLTELWTLLNFIEPFKFPEINQFMQQFGNMASREQVERLQQMISPFMLRRVKEDVAKDIPAKEETVIDVELTSIQKQYYRAIFEHNHAFLSMGASRNSAPKLMNIQMELRKVCNHPFLLDGVEHRESERLYKEMLDKGEMEGKSAEEQQEIINKHGYVMTSGKMVLLDKLLPKLRQEGHKVLIFSQMVKMLDLLSEYCEFRNFRFERLDGRIRGAERQKAIDRFEREEDSFIFMLSTRAGGVGINLTAADMCIIFDSDWNPQNDVQAQARCHRIGQTKEVKVFRLITSRSFEQEMFERASKKLGLEQAVLGTFEKDKEDDKPTQKEMEQLLKRGAYALLEDDNDQITQEFCSDDIEAILAKRTRTRVVEGAKTASWLNKSGMVVSKSKFAAEAGGDDLDMDDPMFWQKVMPDFVTPSIMMQKLNDLIDEIEGKVRGPGRGKGRNKKKAKDDDKAAEDKPEEDVEKPDNKEGDSQDKEASQDDEGVQNGDEEESDEEGKDKAAKLSRTYKLKVVKFMSDLKSMMQDLVDDEDEEGLSAEEKDICQKLLLTISVKERVFNEVQRREARHYLKRMEGDRRRRCRTSDQMPKKPSRSTAQDARDAIPEELRIADRKRKKPRRKREDDDDADDEDAPAPKRKQAKKSGYLGEDGYLHHSDSEADWSDVADLYDTSLGRKDRISRKEARRRRLWGAGDDAATAAGRPWPVFPRHVVKKVLATVLEEVMKYDEEKGGVFSEPVSKEDFPEYFEQIKKPMDYSTMKKKLENGEYRSAQSMQKDFILILQNCRTFNASNSEIVKEARQQHLMRPQILKQAAEKLNLFLSEDGSVLEIFDDDKKGKGNSPKKKGKGVKGERNAESKPSAKKKKPAGKAKNGSKDTDATDTEEDEAPAPKPRIRIKMPTSTVTNESTNKRKSSTKRKREAEETAAGDDAMPEPIPKKSKKKDEIAAKKKAQAEAKAKEKKAQAELKAQATKEKARKASLFSLNAWKKARSSLDGSFKAARDYLTSQGPWELPRDLPADRFPDVAKEALARFKKIDRYSVFAEPVSEDEAPGYLEIVDKPMDFATMKQKVASEDYGTGDKAASAFYKDALQIFDNCLMYNDEDGEIAEEAIRIMGLIPEAYVSACQSVAKKVKHQS